MRTVCFDAAVGFIPQKRKESFDALILHKKATIVASFYIYKTFSEGEPNEIFVRIHIRNPIQLRWKDTFMVLEPEKRLSLGKGLVLNPYSEKVSPKKIKKRVAFLQKLQGDKKEMLLALVQEAGIEGIREKKILQFSSMKRTVLWRLSQELEEEGKLRILAFSPLFLLSKRSFDFLCEKIFSFFSYFHKKYPRERGASIEIIRKRFKLDPKILSLALTRLSKEHQIKEVNKRFALFDFKRDLFPDEERILEKLEEMCFKGEFRSVSLQDLHQEFHLPSQKLNMMLSLLIERKKIVQGKDGFIIHSHWLDEIIAKIRNFGKKELLVADFKKMTGLSRKYAIPLLELMDQMGITQRKGSSREIL